MINNNEIRITIPKFMTHVKKSKLKYFKINGQAIYNGNLHPRTRALVIEKMHEHIIAHLPKDLNVEHLFPLEITLEFHAPINYGDVSLRLDKETNKKKLCWKYPPVGYVPSWDVDNQWIWGKCFNDVLKQTGAITDDCCAFVKSSGRVVWKEVPNIEDRKLVFIIKQYNEQ